MGACCCCTSRRKGSVDGDTNAPDILYFRSDQEISPQRPGDSSRAPLCRPENFSEPVNGSQIRHRDISVRTESTLHDQQRLCESMDLELIPDDTAVSKNPRPLSAPLDLDVLLSQSSETENNLHKLRDVDNKNAGIVSKKTKDKKYSESSTLQVQIPKHKRRGSLEPILFEDDLGSPSEVWLAAQFPDSESNDDASSCDNDPESSELIIKKTVIGSENATNVRFAPVNISHARTSNSNLENMNIAKENVNDLCNTDQKPSNDADVASIHDFEDASISVNYNKQQVRRAHLRKPVLTCVGCIEEPNSKTRHLVTDSMRQGFLDYETCAQLLEGQILSGGILHALDKTSGFNLLSVDEAMQQEVIEASMYQRLLAFETLVDSIYLHNDLSIYKSPLTINRRFLELQSNLGGLLDPNCNQIIPLKSCVSKGIISNLQCAQIANKQVACGGLVHVNPFQRVNLEYAEKVGLIDSDDVIRAMAFETLYEGIRDPLTREPTTYAMCVRRGLLSCHDVIQFLTLQAVTHGGWVRNCFTNEWLPITRAMHEGVIDVEMWESVVKSIQSIGKFDTLIHPLWLRPVSYFDLLKSAEQENAKSSSENVLVIQASDMYQGVYDPRHHERISICEALNRDLTDKHTARRLLQAQMKSGGVIDVARKERVTINEALSRKVVNFSMAVLLVSQQKDGKSPVHSSVMSEENETELQESETLEDLIMKDIVKPIDMMELLQADGYFKGIFDMKTGKNVDISSAYKKGLITKMAVLNVLGTDAQIKGVVNVVTGDTLSVGMATRHGFIDRQTGMRILERQVACGGLLMPPSVVEQEDDQAEQKFGIHDAVKMGIIDPVLGGKLLATEMARSLSTQTTPVSSKTQSLPGNIKPIDIEIAIEGILRDQLCLLGGILDPGTQEVINVSEAVDCGLISPQMAANVLNKYFPKHPVTKLFPMQKEDSIIPKHTEEQSAGYYQSGNNDSTFVKDMNQQEYRVHRAKKRKKKYSKTIQPFRRLSTIYEEDERDVINQQTGQEKSPGELAQDANIDITTGSRVLEGLDPSGKIIIHHDNNGRLVQESMHITIAHRKGLLSEPVAFRLLEAHLAQGGLPDPNSGEKLSPFEALRRGYINEEMATKLADSLKDLTNEQAQVFVFRMNEFICWCCDVENELNMCPFGCSQEKEALLNEIQNELSKIYTLLNEAEVFLNKTNDLLEPDIHEELLFLSDELRAAADSLSISPLNTDFAQMKISEPRLLQMSASVPQDRAINQALADNMVTVENLNQDTVDLESALGGMNPDEAESAADLSDLLEKLNNLNNALKHKSPQVEESVQGAEQFLNYNGKNVDPITAQKLSDEKDKLRIGWQKLADDVQEKLKNTGAKLQELQNDQDRKANSKSEMNRLTPSLKKVYKWVKSNKKRLQSDKPANIACDKFNEQHKKSKITHDRIFKNTEAMSSLLNEAKKFAESTSIQYAYSPKVCEAFKETVNELGRALTLLCDISDKRLKLLDVVKPEVEQFEKIKETFFAWQSSAEETCNYNGQAPRCVDGLKKEIVEITKLNKEINEQNAELKFMEMTAERFQNAATSYNKTLNQPILDPEIDDYWKTMEDEDVLSQEQDSTPETSSYSSSSSDDSNDETNNDVQQIITKAKADYTSIKEKTIPTPRHSTE